MIKVVSWILLSYAAWCGILFLMQRKMLYPTHYITVPQLATGTIPDTEALWITTAAGRVESWYLKPIHPKGSRPTTHIIFAHGNAELIDFWTDELRPLTLFGIGVLLVEYPGYGRSGGSPSQKSITETMVEAYDTLIRTKNATPDRIVLMGRSLGGGAVCSLARKRQTAALILLSTFTSARSFAHRYLVPEVFVLDPFDNLELAATYENPILVIHGKRDEIIPYRHGRTLFETARSGKLISYDCGHNDWPPNWDMFREDIIGFLNDNGLHRKPNGR